MKRFYGQAKTEIDGKEFGQHFVVSAHSLGAAQRKADREDWTHGDGTEEQTGVSVQEIPEAHYNVLKEYIVEI